MLAFRFFRSACRIFLGGVLILLFGSCASTASRVAIPYEIELIADEQVNPDLDGRPSPIQVSIFELKSAQQFDAQDFFSLQADSQHVLGGDVLHREQIVLRPGERRVIRRPGDLQANLIGVVAAYRQLDTSVWRLSLPLPESRSTNIYKFWQATPSAVQLRLQIGKSVLSVASTDP